MRASGFRARIGAIAVPAASTGAGSAPSAINIPHAITAMTPARPAAARRSSVTRKGDRRNMEIRRNKMRVLVACEESQVVCKAFREKRHEAYSCDIVPCSGGHPEWHIQADALEIIKMRWDLIIAHPPCTYLSNAGANRLFDRGGFIKDKDRERKGWEAKSFFEKFLNADCPRVAVENPVPSRYWKMPKYTQIIEPYMFGDPWRKRTCIWLRGLPMLLATDIVIPEGLWTGSSSCRRSDYLLKGQRSSRMRSKTFPGIAKAMAEQWG